MHIYYVMVSQKTSQARRVFAETHQRLNVCFQTGNEENLSTVESIVRGKRFSEFQAGLCVGD